MIKLIIILFQLRSYQGVKKSEISSTDSNFIFSIKKYNVSHVGVIKVDEEILLKDIRYYNNSSSAGETK